MCKFAGMRTWLLLVTLFGLLTACQRGHYLSEGTWEAFHGKKSIDYFLDVRSGAADRESLVSLRPDYYYHPVIMNTSGDAIHWQDTTHQVSFAGTWDTDSTFSGRLVMGADTLQVQFRPTGDRAFPGKAQEPIPPYPYVSDSVVFPSLDTSVMLAGTLSYPAAEGPFPAVVLVSGSGAQDRDCAISGHKPFLVIADHLTRQGFAVLRYDDRGFGLSTGAFVGATTRDFAQDAAGAVKWLSRQPMIDTQHIALAGHSEGGMVVPLAVPLAPETDLMVLLAAPAVPGIDLLIEQNILLRSAMNATPQSTQMNAAMQQDLFGLAIKANQQGWPNDTLEAQALRYLNSLPDSVTTTLGLSSTARQTAAAQIADTWFRQFISYDPVPALGYITQPVLAIFGALDLQVPPHQNRHPLEKALRQGNARSVEVVVLPHLNHLMQTAETGNIYEYFTLEETTAPILLDTLTRWLQHHIKTTVP